MAVVTDPHCTACIFIDKKTMVQRPNRQKQQSKLLPKFNRSSDHQHFCDSTKHSLNFWTNCKKDQ